MRGEVVMTGMRNMRVDVDRRYPFDMVAWSLKFGKQEIAIHEDSHDRLDWEMGQDCMRWEILS